MFRVGIFLDFVWRPGTTRTEGPHGAYVRRARRNRIDRHGVKLNGSGRVPCELVQLVVVPHKGDVAVDGGDVVQEGGDGPRVTLVHKRVAEHRGVPAARTRQLLHALREPHGEVVRGAARGHGALPPYRRLGLQRKPHLLAKKSGNIFRVGIFLDFVWLTTRTPHGAYVRRARRNRFTPMGVKLNGPRRVPRPRRRASPGSGWTGGCGSRTGQAACTV